MKNLFLKQGLFRESETEKGFLKDFNLNKWIKKFLTYINVPYSDDCCDSNQSVPMRYDLNASTIQAYNSSTKQWFNLPASSIGRAVFKANIEVWSGSVVTSTVIENTLNNGCVGSTNVPNYSSIGNTLFIEFPNNCSNVPFPNSNLLVSFYQMSGTPKIAYISPYVSDPNTTFGFTLFDGSGNTINFSDVTITVYVQISIPIL